MKKLKNFHFFPKIKLIDSLPSRFESFSLSFHKTFNKMLMGKNIVLYHRLLYNCSLRFGLLHKVRKDELSDVCHSERMRKIHMDSSGINATQSDGRGYGC